MRFLKSNSFDKFLTILWDNDALKLSFSKPELLSVLYENTKNKNFILTIPICSEFYDNKGLNFLVVKRLFLKENKFFFARYTPTKKVQKKIDDNIIQLKRLYTGLNLPGKPSYPDLYLQSYTLLLEDTATVLTGNISDWNSQIFQTEAVIDFEIENNESPRTLLYFLSLNRKNFDGLVKSYKEKEDLIFKEIFPK